VQTFAMYGKVLHNRTITVDGIHANLVALYLLA
jgi:hypothetical protein